MRLIILSLLGIVHFSHVTSQEIQSRNLQQIQVNVIYLASNYLEGRETGKMGETLAAEYIATQFEALDLVPLGDQDTYIQSFDFEHFTNDNPNVGEPRTGKNVIGFLDNQANSTIVIGAHHDHLGYGTFGSKSVGKPTIHNGADDNASGVAAMLYIAKQILALDLKNNNVLFVAFGGEEMGLYGSKHFIENPTIPLNEINFMLNLNMVGRLDQEHHLIINGVGTSPGWKESIARIENNSLKLKTTDNGIGASDHNSFYFSNIPALHITTGSHKDYHKPSDDSEYINFKGILTIGDFMVELITQMNRVGKLPFTPTMDMGNTPSKPKYKVTLGVRPNYSSATGGVMIEGVIDGRPGQKAGIRTGDVIIKMGTQEVNNIYDYMDGLGQFNPGDTGVITVKRADQVLELEVVFK